MPCSSNSDSEMNGIARGALDLSPGLCFYINRFSIKNKDRKYINSFSVLGLNNCGQHSKTDLTSL